MLIVRGVIGGILLFLGHELNFLFAGAMAALFGVRLTPLLPPQWPYWADYVFIIGLGVIAAGPFCSTNGSDISSPAFWQVVSCWWNTMHRIR